jgi:hypothetical protein
MLVQIIAPECFAPHFSYEDKWRLAMLLPLALGILFTIPSLCNVYYKRRILSKAVSFRYELLGSINSVLLIFFVLYIYLTKMVSESFRIVHSCDVYEPKLMPFNFFPLRVILLTPVQTLDIFNCTPLDPPDYAGAADKEAGRPIKYLVAALEPCGLPGGIQHRLLPGAITTLFCYVIGYPLLVFFVLYTQREKIMEDQYIRAKGQGDDKLSNPNALEIRKRFSRLYFQYKPEFYLWPLCIVIRKCFIAVCLVIFNRNSALQLAGVLVVLFLAYALQIRFLPYMPASEFDDVIRRLELLCYGSPRYASLKATLDKIDLRGKKKLTSNMLEKKIDPRVAAAVSHVVIWLRNTNTVESYML